MPQYNTPSSGKKRRLEESNTLKVAIPKKTKLASLTGSVDPCYDDEEEVGGLAGNSYSPGGMKGTWNVSVDDEGQGSLV